VLLLIDIGNTRIKAAAGEGTSLTPWPSVETACADSWHDWTARAADTWHPARILVSNVAGAEVGRQLARFLDEAWGVQAEFVQPARSCSGMNTRYREPAQLGVDRWLAALAAWRADRGAVVVVDAGTALTVDVVTATGIHLGGLIAPGLDLLRTSLTRGTARLSSAGIEEVDGFADNTQDAISLGCWSALTGLLRETRARVACTSACADATWYVTGGAAPAIERMLDWPVRMQPDLVLRGLAIVAGEAG
jgi:type III pantothenate kinase